MNYQSMSVEEVVQACAHHSDPEAWLEFIARFNRLIAATVIRTCIECSYRHTPGLIEDLIQETYLKICANNCAILREFRPHHPNAFPGFLQALTANIVRDYVRRERADKRDVDSTVELDEARSMVQPGSSHLSPTELVLSLNEIDDLLRRRSGAAVEKERTIFWLYFGAGMTAKEIASIPDMELSIEGVESVIHRLRTFIRKALIVEATR